MKTTRQLGKRIRDVRKQQGLSMEELASRSGVHEKFLGQVERGQQTATIDYIEKIAHGLGIEVFELFVVEDKTPSQLRKEAHALLKQASPEALKKAVALLRTFLH